MASAPFVPVPSIPTGIGSDTKSLRCVLLLTSYVVFGLMRALPRYFNKVLCVLIFFYDFVADFQLLHETSQ